MARLNRYKITMQAGDKPPFTIQWLGLNREHAERTCKDDAKAKLGGKEVQVLDIKCEVNNR